MLSGNTWPAYVLLSKFLLLMVFLAVVVLNVTLPGCSALLFSDCEGFYSGVKEKWSLTCCLSVGMAYMASCPFIIIHIPLCCAEYYLPFYH